MVLDDVYIGYMFGKASIMFVWNTYTLISRESPQEKRTTNKRFSTI